jgi:membrane peptidoglycan carboxypeptidase
MEHYHWRRIFAALAVTLTVIGVVPPLRQAAMSVVSNVVLFFGTPFAPKTADFSKLPHGTRLMAADGSIIGDLGPDGLRSFEPTKVASLPAPVKYSFLAAEDKNFYKHNGVDPTALLRAAFSTLRGKTEGGSTITQQLAKINYTGGERTIFRKFREYLYTTKLERRYSKDQLLERYINQVYFGDGAYGLAAAAKGYFGVKPEQLSAAQAAMIAGKIRAPEYLDPRSRVREVTRRRNQVLVNMQREGWLDDGQLKAAVAEPLNVIPKVAAKASRAPHFVAYVEREAKRLAALGVDPDARATQLFTGGYTIQTTLDPDVYDATVASVRARLGEANDPTTAVATVKPGDGAIRSLFGGLDFAKTQFDMASLSGRQAGSSFKPFVYMAALRDKIDPRTTFNGTSGRVIPCYGDKPVSNYAGEDEGGNIDVDEALVHSVNVVFVDLGCEVGPKKVVRAATDDGVSPDATSAQGAVFLGGLDGDGVNALTMASAFATFAADGVYAEPYAITKITNSDGHVVYQHKAKTHRAFTSDEVGVINRPLQDVIRRGTGTAASLGRPVIGKTGTTQNNIDAWFIGATPDLATGVWVGYPQPKAMSRVHGRPVTGGSFPALVFHDVMKSALRGVPPHGIHTVSPDALDLHGISGSDTKTNDTVPVSTATTDTTLVTDEPTTTVVDQPAETTTTRPPRKTTTTSSPPDTTTTTDPTKAKQSSAPTTTAPG